MGFLTNLGILSTTGTFLTGLYASYQYHLIKSFESRYQEIMNDRKEFFELHDELAETIDHILDQNEERSMIKRYRKSLCALAEGRVLETGVGTSRNIHYYPLGVTVDAIDYSPRMLEKALAKTGEQKINYDQQDVENIEFPDETFDTVVDTFGLEYYVNPRKAQLEMKRVCKKNGKILLLNQGNGDYEQWNAYQRFCQPYNVCKLGFFSNRKWDKLLESMGFNIILKKRLLQGTIYFNVINNDSIDIVYNKVHKNI